MSDQFSEVSHQGWLSRLGSSIKGMLVGVLLFLGSFVLLFWNEGRAVTTARSLNEGEAATVSIEAASIDPDAQGKLVHVQGEATTDDILSDPLFDVREVGIRLVRNAEMYQWHERKETRTKSNTGGSKTTTTTYHYDKKWSSSRINSNSFHRRSGHENPDSMPIQPQTFRASTVTLGAFKLPDSLVSSIENPQTLVLTDDNIPEDFKDRMRLAGSQQLYLGNDPSNPQVGDVRVSMILTSPSNVSVCAQQSGQTFVPYQTHAGDALSMLEMGSVSAHEMFQHARTRNTIMTWVLRAVGTVAMFAGMMFLTAPLVILGDFIPLIGSIVHGGSALVAGAFTVVFASLTIGLAWIFYRPLIGVPLLAIAAGGVFYLIAQRTVGIPRESAGPETLSEADVVG